jgi:hypothetical protein
LAKRSGLVECVVAKTAERAIPTGQSASFRKLQGMQSGSAVVTL